MKGTKECTSCHKVLPLAAFVKPSNICAVCKQQNKEARISNTYHSYLNNLFNQSRSTNKKTRQLEWQITLDDLLEMWEKQGGRCAISGAFLTHHKDGSGTKEWNVSIDRIVNTRGYTPQNTQLVCHRVNLMKHTLSEDMFYWWVKTINDFTCD